jgi:lipopolysaccharide export system permease protein
MRLLDRYIGRTVAGGTFLVTLALIAIFSFFQFLDELDSVGRGRYGVVQAIEYVLLSVPSLVYEMLPMAALIGSLIGLGALTSNSEITVMRAAGVSLARIIFAVLKAAAVIVVIAVLIGEFVAPPSEALASHRRSVAIADQIALKTRHGFWARDSQSYINIRRILPGDRVEEIYIYEFDEDDRLTASTFAQKAFYRDGQWILEDIEQTFFSTDGLTRQHLERAHWHSLLRPELLSLVVIEPNNLSVWDLASTIRYLRSNDQNSLRYEQAFWVKVFYPLAAGVMVFLAIPLVLRAERSVSMGKRIVLGALIGLAFHILNQAGTHIGAVYNLAPIISVSFPTALTFFIALYLTFHLGRA